MLTTEQIRTLIQEDRLEEFYKDWYWRMLALRIIKEEHGECRMCKDAHKLKKATLVHHIQYLRDHPELAYERSNLMPLCHDCHERIHGRGIYGRPSGFTNVEKW
ncbi:MAG: HNH endonuclease [Ruminococcus sp.]|nr:HNH endonuclease [Ruminococcus sp.]